MCTTRKRPRDSAIVRLKLLKEKSQTRCRPPITTRILIRLFGISDLAFFRYRRQTPNATRTSSKRFVCGIQNDATSVGGLTSAYLSVRDRFSKIFCFFIISRRFGGRRRNAFKSRVKPIAERIAYSTTRIYVFELSDVDAYIDYTPFSVPAIGAAAAAAAGPDTAGDVCVWGGGEGARSGTATFTPSDTRANTRPRARAHTSVLPPVCC